jgi:hypothetical protein
VRAAPVGHDESLKAQVCFQHGVEGLIVLARPRPVHFVIAAHHAPHPGLYGAPKGLCIDLHECALVQVGADCVAVGLLVVVDIVLGVGHDARVLNALHCLHHGPVLCHAPSHNSSI